MKQWITYAMILILECVRGSWITYEYNQYMLNTTSLWTFANASMHCNSRNASLASLETAQELQFVINILKSNNVTSDLWIGSFPSEPAQHSSGTKGSTKNVCYKIQTALGMVHETSCTDRYGYICKRENPNKKGNTTEHSMHLSTPSPHGKTNLICECTRRVTPAPTTAGTTDHYSLPNTTKGYDTNSTGHLNNSTNDQLNPAVLSDFVNTTAENGQLYSTTEWLKNITSTPSTENATDFEHNSENENSTATPPTTTHQPINLECLASDLVCVCRESHSTTAHHDVTTEVPEEEFPLQIASIWKQPLLFFLGMILGFASCIFLTCCLMKECSVWKRDIMAICRGIPREQLDNKPLY